MAADDRGAADRLDRELDRTADTSPAGTGRPAGDGALADTHRRVRALDTTPGPDPAFVRRLMEDLMSATTVPAGAAGYPTPNGRVPVGTGAPSASSHPARADHRRWRPLGLAAAVVLLALGGVALAVAVLDPQPGRNPVIPAAVLSPATPTVVSTGEEVLLDAEVPAGLLPHGDMVFGGLNHVTVPEGTTTWDAASGGCCPGIRVDYVLRGGLTVQVGAPATVVRADGTEEPVPAGGSVAIETGDALLAANDAGVSYTAGGAEPVELLFWILFDESEGSYSTDPIPLGWELHRTDFRGGHALPDGPARLRLRRVELVPGGSLAAAPLRWGVTPLVDAAGTPVPPVLYVRSDGGLTNDGDTPLDVYVASVAPLGGAPATPGSSPTT
jgi:hypothetical protein